MFKQIIFSLTITTFFPLAIQAQKPSTFLGKLSASTVQTMHQHATISSAAIITAGAALNNYFSDTKLTTDFIFPLGVIALVAGSMIIKSGTQALMNNFDIEPLDIKPCDKQPLLNVSISSEVITQ